MTFWRIAISEISHETPIRANTDWLSVILVGSSRKYSPNFQMWS